MPDIALRFSPSKGAVNKMNGLADFRSIAPSYLDSGVFSGGNAATMTRDRYNNDGIYDALSDNENAATDFSVGYNLTGPFTISFWSKFNGTAGYCVDIDSGNIVVVHFDANNHFKESIDSLTTWVFNIFARDDNNVFKYYRGSGSAVNEVISQTGVTVPLNLTGDSSIFLGSLIPKLPGYEVSIDDLKILSKCQYDLSLTAQTAPTAYDEFNSHQTVYKKVSTGLLHGYKLA